MKTRANSFVKLLFIALMIPALMVGCGKENKSGGGSKAPADPWAGNNVNGVGNMSLPGDWITRLYNEYPCASYYGNNNNARRKLNVTSPGPFQVNSGTLHVGVTLEGDILVIANNANTVRAELHACERPNLRNEAQFIQMPILNVSDTCAMAEITAADIYLNSEYGVYHLAFFPAGLSSQTSLCR